MSDRRCRTNKVRFDTEEAARRRLAEIQAESTRAYTPSGVLWCGLCQGFHLTSRSGKRWRNGKRTRDRRV